jgi:hypothetical protein
MSAAAASLGRGDADRWLAEAVIKIIGETPRPRSEGRGKHSAG